MTESTVLVTHRIPGFHCWPNAPGEVAYLSNTHRHLFLMIAAWKVGHDDRDVEFHTAQAWMRKVYAPNTDFGAQSCEMIAKDMFTKLTEAGHRAPAWIEIWEDGEAGAKVVFS